MMHVWMFGTLARMMLNAAVVRTDSAPVLQVFAGRMMRAKTEMLVRRLVGSVKLKSPDAIHPVKILSPASVLSTIDIFKACPLLTVTQGSAVQMGLTLTVLMVSTAMQIVVASLVVCAVKIESVVKGFTATPKIHPDIALRIGLEALVKARNSRGRVFAMSKRRAMEVALMAIHSTSDFATEVGDQVFRL